MRTYRILAMFIAVVGILNGCGNEPSLVINVEGGLIEGMETVKDGVYVFKGIPYAAPPVGDLRWREPQSVIPWEGIRPADQFANPCTQSPHTPGGYTPEFFFQGDPEFSEDCLYLNVWTPAPHQPSKKLPVALWIHGGGYTAGWGSEPEMDGAEWASHGVILVTFNYRLGIFGFFTHPLLSSESEHGVSGNYGMLDQIAALKWVKNNIARFGGDPDRVTIFGQSAGAMSVQTLVTSPLSKDLISGAIIQSGGGISDRPILGGTALQTAQQSGKTLMDWAGCTSLEQMRALSTDELFNLPSQYMARTGERLRITTSPVVDGYALPETFSEAALGGRISDVPYMIGGTSGDMKGLGVGSGVGQFCLARQRAGGKSYAYQFARELPTDGRPNVLVGAFHSSELWYIFKSLRYCWRPFTMQDYELAEDMITCWTNFTKYGDPNGKDGSRWTPFTESSPEYMVFKLDENGEPAPEMKALQ